MPRCLFQKQTTPNAKIGALHESRVDVCAIAHACTLPLLAQPSAAYGAGSQPNAA